MTHQDNTIQSQAAHYADMIKRTGRRHLVFFPLRKSMQATSNQFRFTVLQHLVGAPYHGTMKDRLAHMEKSAKAAGFYLYEVNAADYDSKQYKAEISRQLRIFANGKDKVGMRSARIRDYTKPNSETEHQILLRMAHEDKNRIMNRMVNARYNCGDLYK